LLKNMVDMSKNLIFIKQAKPARDTDICQHNFVQCCIAYVQVLDLPICSLSYKTV